MSELLTVVIALVVGVVAIYTIRKSFLKNPKCFKMTILNVLKIEEEFDTRTGEEL